MTLIRNETFEGMGAVPGSENPLPQFRCAENLSVRADAGIPAGERSSLGWQVAPRVLPCRMQDSYTREIQPRAWRSWVLENEFLRAQVVPELGGRIISLIHKPTNRELVEKNPVLRLANRGVRNAWFSGGIEWNPVQSGHSCYSCSPVYAARAATPGGDPVLRLYEWDRICGVAWQIDLHLPNESQFMYARVRLVNPRDFEVPVCWFTNIAVPETAGTRVLCPADALLWTGNGEQVSRTALPASPETDPSYPARMTLARESFFRLAPDQPPWIAALDAEGRGLVHLSTARLRGRYLFCWGNSPGGRRWPEYLSQADHPFAEIRAGLGQTRLESLPMPAGAHWTWTEAFGMLEADPARVHSNDWNAAWRAAGEALAARLTPVQLDELDQEFAATTSRPVQAVLCTGSGWGALERRRLAAHKKKDSIPSELTFVKDYSSPANDKSMFGPPQEPWAMLLESNILPDRNPVLDPGQFMVEKEWQALLEQSLAARRGDNWHSWYHLGIMRFEAFDYVGAREAWLRSLKHRRTAWVLRNLAVLEAREGRLEPACELLRQALEAMPRVIALAVEYARLLWQMGQYEKVRQFTDSASDIVKQNDEIRLLGVRAMLKLGKVEGNLEAFFNSEFATLPVGDATLTQLWLAWQECLLAKTANTPATDELRQKVRRECPVSSALDFRLYGEECHQAIFSAGNDVMFAPVNSKAQSAAPAAPVPVSAAPVAAPVAVPPAPAASGLNAATPANVAAAMRQTGFMRKSQIELSYVMENWAALPDAARAAIIELVRNAKK